MVILLGSEGQPRPSAPSFLLSLLSLRLCHYILSLSVLLNIFWPVTLILGPKHSSNNIDQRVRESCNPAIGVNMYLLLYFPLFDANIHYVYQINGFSSM